MMPSHRNRTSLVDDLTASLSREIVAGRFDADKRLPTEPNLSSRFGVSRTVVREATQQLVSRGLVEIERGRGVMIVNRLHKPLSLSLELTLPEPRERICKLMEARQLIEPAVARLAAVRAKAADLKRLRRLQADLRAATDTTSATEIDIEFHRALTKAGANEILALMLESVTDLGRASRLATNANARWPQAIAGHAEILTAIERHDAAGAERAMVAHLELAARTLQDHFAGRRA